MMPSCCARLDRVQVVSSCARGQKPPAILGFEVVSDHFVPCQTSTQTYARCRRYRSTATAAQIFWQYDRRKGWLMPWKVTLVADDRWGLSWREVGEVVRHCGRYRLLLVELALDFTKPSRVTQRYVLRHGVFGKSRCRRSSTLAAAALYYGSRKSGKLVRCYAKEELGVFRVEVEFHSSLLRHHHIAHLDELVTVGRVLYPRHVCFVDLDWSRLGHNLATRKGEGGTAICAEAQRRATSIQRAARYLRKNGIANVHRFFVALAVNEEIERALRRWGTRFRRSTDG